MVAKSRVARGQEYKVYNRIRVSGIVHKSSRLGNSRGEMLGNHSEMITLKLVDSPGS